MLLSLVFLSSLATRVQVLLLLLIALLIAQLLLTVLLLIALLLIALLLLTLQRLIALRLNLSDKQKSLKLFPQGKQLFFWVYTYPTAIFCARLHRIRHRR